MKYILLNYAPDGSTYTTATGFFQNVLVSVGIQGDTKGFIQNSIAAIKLDTTKTIADALADLSNMVQSWVDTNYNS